MSAAVGDGPPAPEDRTPELEPTAAAAIAAAWHRIKERSAAKAAREAARQQAGDAA